VKHHPFKPALAIPCGLLLVAGLACENFNRRELPPEPPPPLDSGAGVLVDDTVGELTLVDDAAPRQVKGFGLVVGLDGTGSRNVAATIRDYLLDRLQKSAADQAWMIGRESKSLNELLESRDTAIVELTAYIPPGAPEGLAVDVGVTAARGTETTSLDGGLLLPSELKLVGVASNLRGIITGRTVAMAEGPIFVSPFATAAAAGSTSSARDGIVLGGARVVEPRPLRVVLRNPSYPAARQIEQRINERFSLEPPTAEPMSHSYLHVSIPPRYRQLTTHFVQLVAHLYVENNPAFIDARLRELDRYAAEPGGDHRRLSLAWEGIGRTALPYVKRHYLSSSPALTYYAARAGIDLGDVRAVGILGTIASDPEHPFRLQATQTLVRAPYGNVTLELLPLLAADDPEIRAAAYEGLLKRRHRAVRSQPIHYPLDHEYVSFYLDVVDTPGPPMVYARRTENPRIALFGQDIPVTTPLFLRFPERNLTLNANENGDPITIIARIMPEAPLETFYVPANLQDLVRKLALPPKPGRDGRPEGIGLSYGGVLDVIAALRDDGALPAPLVFQKASLRDLIGPATPPERPEADEAPAEDFELELDLEPEPEEPPPAPTADAEPDALWQAGANASTNPRPAQRSE